ncbi:MAG: hypoxanthine phosphoribosyltransferase [Solobacterium sp.]|nr:hypoxanthine phosphoribosyltransferase [Solobacterium sp.]MDY2953012.1 hypoxanthine phosphoribosyltransferase [Erysipelotrichaceae bacterium]MCI6697443.1 hypoxanthine phosphoribosyltransferase [Solobacterium sp.]MCI6846450.1 hypoxanthine phosphoribosyltransferase [Solobacterium sp.]MCI6877589.1 hypoxanthine phosphoribosyltransferase [Solobacterium sp.]
MHNDVKKILVSSEEITKREKELADEISKYYKEKNSVPVIVGLLKGSVPFMMGLVIKLDIDCEIDFMDVSSYSGTNSIEVRVIKDIEGSVTDRDVLIVEDIVDTGKTLEKVTEMFRAKGAKEIKIVTLLDKPARREKAIEADYVGFVVPDEFVIGYGLDYNQKYRNLPYIGVIKEEAI